MRAGSKSRSSFAPLRREFFGAALDTIDVVSGGTSIGLEQMSRLAIRLIIRPAGLGVERDILHALNLFFRNDVPGILKHDVGRKKIE